MIYKIKKGRHYCNFKMPRLHNGPDELNFTVIFDKSCSYKLDTPDDLDVNKLYGISYAHVHQDSIRIGWNIDPATELEPERIALYLYTYNNEIRKYSYLASCDYNKPVKISFNFDYASNLVYVTLNPVYIENHLSKRVFYKESFIYPKIKVGYYNKVYFGGTSKSPSDMKIAIFED